MESSWCPGSDGWQSPTKIWTIVRCITNKNHWKKLPGMRGEIGILNYWSVGDFRALVVDNPRDSTENVKVLLFEIRGYHLSHSDDHYLGGHPPNVKKLWFIDPGLTHMGISAFQHENMRVLPKMHLWTASLCDCLPSFSGLSGKQAAWKYASTKKLDDQPQQKNWIL